MKLLRHLICICLLAAAARAANPNVIYDTAILTGESLTNVLIEIEPLLGLTQSNRAIVLNKYTNRTDYTGRFTVTNMVPNAYRVTVRHRLIDTPWTNNIPDTNGTIYEVDYRATSLSASNAVGYSQAQANSRFVLKASGVATNLQMVATNTPSAGDVWTATDSSGHGNWGSGSGISGATATNIVNAGFNLFSVTNNGTIFAQSFGVVADGVTDNFLKLTNLNQFLATNGGRLVKFPQGTIAATNSSWLRGVRNAHLDFSGAALINNMANPYSTTENYPLTINADPAIDRGIGLFSEYGRRIPNPIGSLAIGATNAQLLTITDATNYHTGDWMQLSGYEQQGNGFPRNFRFVEYLKVSAVSNSTGIVYFDRPTRFFYDSNWFNLVSDSNVGPAGLLSLDRTNFFHFAENIMVENLTVLANPAETNQTAIGVQYRPSGSFVVAGVDNFLGRNIRAEAMFVGGAANARFERCEFTYCEPDKQGGTLVMEDCDIGSIAEGTGFETIILRHCRITGTLALYPRNLIVEDCDLWNVPSVTASAGWNVRSFVFRNNRLHLAPGYRGEVFGGVATEMGATYPDAPAPYAATVVTSNSTSRITVSALPDYSLRLYAGFGTVLHGTNGSYGVITNITFATNLTQTNFLIDYMGDTPFRVGERLRYHIIQNLTEVGTVRVYGERGIPLNQQWKPAEHYTSASDGIGDETIDVVWSQWASNTIQYQVIDGWIDQIVVNVDRAYSGAGDARLQISAAAPFGTDFADSIINTAIAGERKIGANDISGAQTSDILSPNPGRYIYNLTLRLLGADNRATNAFQGSVRIKAHRRITPLSSTNSLIAVSRTATGFGIGTNSPAAALHVHGTNLAFAFADIRGGNARDPNGNYYVTNSTGIDGGAGGGEANVNGETSVTNATRIGWVYGKSSVTNLLRSVQGGNGIVLTNQGTNVMVAIDPAVVASQADLTGASNGAVNFTMTASNDIVTAEIVRNTTTSNGVVALVTNAWTWPASAFDTNQSINWALSPIVGRATNIVIIQPSNSTTLAFQNEPSAGGVPRDILLQVNWTNVAGTSFTWPANVVWPPDNRAPGLLANSTNFYWFTFTGTNIFGFAWQTTNIYAEIASVTFLTNWANSISNLVQTKQHGSANLTNWANITTNDMANVPSVNFLTNWANAVSNLVQTKQFGSAILTNISGTGAVTNLYSAGNTNTTAFALIQNGTNTTGAIKTITGGANITITENGSTNISIASSGGGSLATNANQFGANTTLTIKDGAMITNANVFGTLGAVAANVTNNITASNFTATAGGTNTFGATSVTNFGTPLFLVNAGRSNAAVPGLIFFSTTSFTNLNAAGTMSNLANVSISGHTLTNSGDAIRAEWFGVMPAAAANTNQFQIIFGSTTLLDTGLQIASNTVFRASALITRTGNTSQHVDAHLEWGPSGGVPFAFTNINLEAAETNGIATTLALKGGSRRVGAHTNNSFRVWYEPTSAR